MTEQVVVDPAEMAESKERERVRAEARRQMARRSLTALFFFTSPTGECSHPQRPSHGQVPSMAWISDGRVHTR